MKKILIFGLMLLLAGCKDVQQNELFERAVIEPGSNRVIDQHGQLEHMELFHQFLKDVEDNEHTTLEVTRYTIEGAPIYWAVEFNGDHFNIEIDNREDAWGSKNIENYQCGKLTQDATGSLTDYNFTSCEGGFEINLLSVIKE